MRNCICLALLVVLLCNAAYSSANDVLRTDPNINRKEAQKSVDTPKISYEGVDIELADLLSNISKLSKTQLQPSSSPESWQVRERTVTVFLNDMTVQSFKDDLAELMKYRWTKVDENNSNLFVLRETASARQYRIDLTKAKELALYQEISSQIDSAITDATRALEMSQDDIQKARETDPWLYYLSATPAGREWAQALKELPIEVLADAARGENMWLQLETLSADCLHSLEQILSLPPTGTSVCLDSDARRYPIMSVRLESRDPELGSDNPAAFLSIYVKTDQEHGHREVESFPIGNSNCFGCYRVGQFQLLTEKGIGHKEASITTWDKALAHTSEMQKKTPEQPKDDPAMLRQITHEPLSGTDEDEPALVKHLRSLAKESGMNIMLESFATAPTYCGAVAKEGTVKDVLESIIKGSDLIWEKTGSTIILRYPDWAQRRAAEVPKALVARWEKRATYNCGLSYDDLLDIVENTTYEQRWNTLARNPLLVAAGIQNTLSGTLHEALVINSKLETPELRASLRSKPGVSASVLAGVNLESEHIQELAGMSTESGKGMYISVSIKSLPSDNKYGQQEVILLMQRKDETWTTSNIGYTAPARTLRAYLQKLRESMSKIPAAAKEKQGE